MVEDLCIDCGLDVYEMDEYSYMVHKDIWEESRGKEGKLCIGCLEARIGRKLTPDDFNNALLNDDFFTKSARLASRMTGV